MANLIIFGAGDIARLAHFYFKTDTEHEVVAFTVDKAYREADECQGLPLVDFENITDTYPPSEYQAFVALSYAKMNQVRTQKYLKCKELGYEVISYVSSRCSYLTEHPVGENCFILEDNTVQPFVKLGDNVTLWSGNHIGHDSTIDDNCFITSHVVVSGNCHIGKNCFIGVNATLRNSLTVAPFTLIGAGAIIMKDTNEKDVYVPERAKLFKKKSDEIEM
ncbi:MAG: acetyltransferase [Candidatus Omnitrophica bacterium]|nr:acetyltransferase [Candidatus Omnitrophota bacterium]MCA9426319.1 acetyltransferase [Candidatus Omnitrophota bacterium]MCA9447496.1 acetyltransferase [Candidatus Omnitrophota bacterium]